jgi:hypothetical protein
MAMLNNQMVTVKHTLDGGEILHQKDGWNMLKPYE